MFIHPSILINSNTFQHKGRSKNKNYQMTYYRASRVKIKVDFNILKTIIEEHFLMIFKGQTKNDLLNSMICQSSAASTH